MVFQEIYASRHFQVNASSVILLRSLSPMIRMKTCQSLSTRPSIGQEISKPWAHSQFVYLFLAGRDKTATVKKDFSFANLRISTSRFSTYTECGQMVKYITGTRLYGNGSIISSFPGAGPQCESSEKKEQLILKMLSFSNIDRKVMNISKASLKILYLG